MQASAIFFVSTLLFVSSSVTSAVRLVGHGYENLVVTVSAGIRENPNLLTMIEGIFTEASNTMLKSTKNQLYIKEVVVAIPKDWQTRRDYENAADLDIKNPDVKIDHPNLGYSDRPYTRGYRGCGLQGQFIHLTPRYILDDQIRLLYGSPGKLIVHEWGHLRWGLFDEYPMAADQTFYSYEGEWHPTRCSTEVHGKLRNKYSKKDCTFNFQTGKPGFNCEFLPDDNNKAISSLMFMQFLENVIEFCDHPSEAPKHLRHNKLAPNLQNILCHHSSAWEVMRNHSDFISLSNQEPLPNTTDTQPVFRYVQWQPRKRVLVFDVSDSMEDRPLEVLRQAAGNYILSSVERRSWLGIVQFSNSAKSLSPMTKIKSEEDRISLANLLPSSVQGATSIGAGLQAGLQLLSSVGNPSGGSIILVTDGLENRFPFIEQLEPLILKNRVVVHAFAYGQEADLRIADLANVTGGNVVFYSGSENSTALIDGLAATMDISRDTLSNEDVYLSVLTDARKVTQDTPSSGTFHIDSTIGRDAYLTFSYTEPIQVAIQSPNASHGAQNIRDYANLKIIKVFLGSVVAPGVWSYKVTTKAESSAITVNIQSKPRSKDNEVIQVSAWVVERADVNFDPTRTIAVYADVTIGKTPVLNASVMAIVERPEAKSLDLPLYDKGVGSDIIKEDGVYSANIIATDFTGNGRYNIKIKVTGTKGETKVITGGQSSARGAFEMIDRPLGWRVAPLEAFQRVTTAGEFRLRNFVKVTVDRLPPARILDLHAKRFDAKEGRATLQWTAVGGDMDRGQASQYILYLAWDLDSLLGNLASATRILETDVLQGTLSSPSPPGEREEYVISVRRLDIRGNKTAFLSVVALDEAGNEGQASNVITLANAERLSIGGVLYQDSSSDSATMYIALGVTIPAFLILIVVLILLYRYWRRRRRRRSHGREDKTARQNKPARSTETLLQELTRRLKRRRAEIDAREEEKIEDNLL